MTDINYATAMHVNTIRLHTYMLQNKHKWRVYQKVATIQARPAVAGERIDTIMKTGHLETSRVVPSEGLFMVIKNPDGEIYFTTKEKFGTRYIKGDDIDGTWSYYEATGKFIGVEYDGSLGEEFSFTPPGWNEHKNIHKGYFVGGPTSEFEKDLYGIAPDEFRNTYKFIYNYN